MSGFTPSTFDSRDFDFSAPGAVASARKLLPVPFVRDQRDVPCCVSIAVTTCMEILDAASPPAVQLSPLFNYWVTRENPALLTDLQPRDALMSATMTGICRAALHHPPYTASGARTPPGRSAVDEAAEHRIFRLAARTPHQRSFWFERLASADRAGEWRAAILAGLPVLFGFWLTESYWAWRGQNLFRPPRLSLQGERGQQGHCAVAVGVGDRDFVIQDSRGPRFASNSRWVLPRPLLESPLVAEAWVIRRINYD